MAKKRTGPESGISGGGPAAARDHRQRNRVSPPPAPYSPSSGVTETPADYRRPGVLEAGAEAADHTPEYREIEGLAYSYWEARGRQGGSPEEDWLKAERELRERRAVTAM